MNVPGPAAQQFSHALDQLPPPELRGPEMLAVRLARACVAALPVDGAGLSIHDPGGLRTPIGASDATTSRAERLQFTHGAGPCLRAHDDGVQIAFDEAEITHNWPELHDALVADTPFRAVLSVPLLPPLGPLVVLDLYVRNVAALPATDREDIADVTIALTRAMVAAALGAPVVGRHAGLVGRPGRAAPGAGLAGDRDGGRRARPGDRRRPGRAQGARLRLRAGRGRRRRRPAVRPALAGRAAHRGHHLLIGRRIDAPPSAMPPGLRPDDDVDRALPARGRAALPPARRVLAAVPDDVLPATAREGPS